MSIENEKDNIIAILKENGYDTNSPDTISLLSSIINNRIVSYIHSDKDTIIRTLSKEEYEKYIVNGTCDGAVTSNSKNVYNHLFSPTIYGLTTGHSERLPTKNTTLYVYPLNSNIILKFDRSSLKYYDGTIHTHNEKIFACMLTNNNYNMASTYSSYSGYVESYGFYGHPSYGVLANYNYKNIVPGEYTNKENIQVILASLKSTSRWTEESRYSDANSTYNLVGQLSFRPVFQYKDNNKSKNLYY